MQFHVFGSVSIVLSSILDASARRERGVSPPFSTGNAWSPAEVGPEGRGSPTVAEAEDVPVLWTSMYSGNS